MLRPAAYTSAADQNTAIIHRLQLDTNISFLQWFRCFAELLTGQVDRVMLLENISLPIVQQVAAFDFTEEDILVCSFPKSGNIVVIMQRTGSTIPYVCSTSPQVGFLFLKISLDVKKDYFRPRFPFVNRNHIDSSHYFSASLRNYWKKQTGY